MVKQVRRAVSALLSHALPACRRELLLLGDVSPQEAAEALSTAPGSFAAFADGGGAAADPGAAAFASGAPFALASDGAIDLLGWLWPLTHAPGRRAALLARQLHQRMCLEVEMAAAEAAEAAGLPPSGGSAGGVRAAAAAAAPDGSGPSARWLRAVHPGRAGADRALAPPLLLACAAPPLGGAAAPAAAAAAAAAGGGAEARAWLRALEAAAEWASWALDQR